MKTSRALGLLALAILFIIPGKSAAQDTYKPFNVNASLKTMHLWRGYKVTDDFMSGINAYYKTQNGKLTVGLWNGQSLEGDYTEFDYYFSLALTDGLSLSVWDINNFSSYPGADIFNYTNDETSHFVDATLAFQATDALGLSWSTILAGRDFHYDDNGDAKNSFSNYVEASYTAYTNEDLTVGLKLGGAFAFADDSHFYDRVNPDGTGTDAFSIVNIGASVSKKVTLFDQVLPIGVTAMWNPEQKYGAMELSFSLF